MSAVDATGPESFGQMIQRLREARGMSQERLEALAGYVPGGGMVSQIEGGKRGTRLSRDRLVAFAQAFGVPVTEILKAAGKLTPEEARQIANRPSFADFVNADPNLRIDQKRMLIALYRTYTPKEPGSGGSGG